MSDDYHPRRDYRREPRRAARGRGATPPPAAGRRPPPARRPPPRRRRGAHTLLWLVLFLGIAVMAGFAVVSRIGSSGGGGGTDTSTTQAPPRVKVTFPEGLRREEMADILEQKAGLSKDRYLELTAAGARGAQLAGTDAERSLEGFLFPATYDVGDSTTVEDIVDAQVEAYRQRAEDIDQSYARSKNLTRYDVLIIASMVEREVRVASERPIVAGIIYNRLKADMRLDIDATVQYALGSWKTELTAADLAIDSPYNTRRFKGLPPGPICNPGDASLIAAAKPARSTYLYYVARADGSGRHYFARTAAEFEAAVARARANAGG